MKKYIGILVLLVIVLVGFNLPAMAGKAKIIPGGPFVPPNQEVNLSAIMTFDEVEAELLKMEKRSKGMLQSILPTTPRKVGLCTLLKWDGDR